MSRVGIIAALPAEAESLYSGKIDIASPLEIHPDIFLCLSGMGHESAFNSVNKLIQLNINALISWGTAGAIDSRLKPGDLVLADNIKGNDNSFIVSSEWLNRLNAYFKQQDFKTHIGTIVSINQMCNSVTEKTALAKQTDAIAVDMESAVVAEMSKQHGLNFIAVRAIADEINDTIPAVVMEHTNNLAEPVFPGFLLSCLQQPKQIFRLVTLARRYKMAIKTLKQSAPDLRTQHFLYRN